MVQIKCVICAAKKIDNCELCSIESGSTSPKCTQCLDGYILQNSVCVLCDQVLQNCLYCSAVSSNVSQCYECKTGYFYNKSSSACQLCSSVDGAKGCASCYRNQYEYYVNSSLYTNESIVCTSCLKGYQYDSANGICQSCKINQVYKDGNCIDCTKINYSGTYVASGLNSGCYECSIVNNYRYCTSCIEGFYQQDSQCYNCTSNDNNCIKCHLDYYMVVQNEEQANGSDYYYSQSYLKCDLCKDGYTYDSEQRKCTSCSKGLFLLNSICVQCSSYISNCAACTSAASCQYCKQGYYLNSTGQCRSCSVDAGQYCKNCYYSAYYYKYYNIIASCSRCEAGHYIDYSNYPYYNCSKCLYWEYQALNGTCLNCLIEKCYSCNYDGTCKQCESGYGYKNGKCQNCSLFITGCTQCIYNSTIDDLTCQYCEGGRFYNKLTKKCETCSSVVDGCSYCWASDYKYTSYGSITLSSSQIFSCYSCKSGFYYNYDSSTCQSCEQSSTGCLSCYQSYYWYTSSNQKALYCYQCKTGYTRNYETQKCEVDTTCDSNCQYCYKQNSSITKSQCESCKEGYTLNYTAGTCSKNRYCPSNSFQNGNICVLCNDTSRGGKEGCYRCNVYSQSSQDYFYCSWCHNDYRLVNGYDYSGDYSQYCVLSPGQINCPRGCSSCILDGSFPVCTSCQSGYVQNGLTCKLNCNQYATDLNSNLYYPAKYSDNKCPTCYLQDYYYYYQPYCSDCNNGFFLYDGTCFENEECPEGKVFDSTKLQCISCKIDNCVGCRIQLTQQSSQTDDGERTTYQEDGNNETFVWDDGAYYKQTIMCVACNDSYLLQADGSCKYVGYSTVNCGPGCSECSWNSKFGTYDCTKCSSFSNITLVTNSTTGLRSCQVTSSKVISNCIDNWIDSNGSVICRECESSSYVLTPNRTLCVFTITSSCTTSQYYDFQNQSCLSCPSNCLNCEWNSGLQYVQCLYCKTNYSLTLKNTCVKKTATLTANCPSGYFDQTTTTKKCVKCPNNCDTCSQIGDYMICDKCTSGFNLTDTDGQCVEEEKEIQCPDGYYASEDLTSNTWSCKYCPKGCESCFQNSNTQSVVCTECVDTINYYLNEVSGSCLYMNCSKGQLFNKDSGCVSCPLNCETCIYNLNNTLQCVKCYDSNSLIHYSIVNGLCKIASCSSPLTLTSQGQCAQCPTNCSQCVENSATLQLECTGCVQSAQLFNKQCIPSSMISSCVSQEKKYYGKGGDYWIMGCWNCPTGCAYCNYDSVNDMVSCNSSSCLTGYSYDSSSQSCILSLTITVNCTSTQMTVYDPYGTPYCKNCSEECASCRYDAINEKVVCLNCSTGYYYSTEIQGCVQINESLQCAEGCETGNCTRNPSDPNNPNKLYSTQCQFCMDGYQLIGTQCFKICDSGYKAIITTTYIQVCEQCQAGCTSCYLDYFSSPPQEVCLECDSSYYLTDKQCKLLPQCENSYYLVLFQNSTVTTAQCVSCPIGCSLCKSTKQTAQLTLSSVICQQCENGYTLQDNEKCILDIQASSTLCEATEYATLTTGSSSLYSCHACNNNLTPFCQSCHLNNVNDTVPLCTECISGYLLRYNASSSLYYCESLACDSNDQYKYAVDSLAQNVKCYYCPEECATCYLKDVHSLDTLKCTLCQTGYELNSDGKCVKSADSGNYTCEKSSQYPVIIDSQILCLNCPSGCSSCSLSNIQDVSLTSELKCTACNTGFNLASSGQCTAICYDGQYAVLYNNTSICESCHYSCKKCYGGNYTQCLECQADYVLTEYNTCEKEEEFVEPNCTELEYYDSTYDECLCIDGYMWDPTALECMSISDLVQDCGVGQFNWNGMCLACNSTDNQGFCILCTGPEPSQCSDCAEGYYLNSTYACVSCGDGCSKCTTGSSCDQCEPGYFRYKDSQGNMKCLTQCPNGMLPYLPSLYYLNKDLFTEAVINKQINPQKYANQTRPKSAYYAKAIDVSNWPKFSVPYEIQDEEITYNGVLVNLDCVPCYDHCSGCPSDMYYNKISTLTTDYKNQDMCYYNQCPMNRVVKVSDSNNLCVDKVEFDIIDINFTTITCAQSIQSISKPLIVNVTTTLDQNLTQAKLLSFKWTITDVVKVYTNGSQTTLSDSDKLEYAVKLFSGVKNLLRVLKIPASNLVENLQYTFKVVVSNSYEDIELSKSVLVRKISVQSKSIDSLGADNNLITVTPEKGISGSQKFTARYVYDNVQSLKRCNDWKYSISVVIDSDNKIKLTSSKPNDYVEFIVPGNTESNETLKTIFTISNQEEQYTATRQFVALKNIAYNSSAALPLTEVRAVSNSTVNYTSIEASPLSDSVLSQALAVIIKEKAVSEQQCPQLSLLKKKTNLLTQGACNMTDANPCCGQGVCIQNNNSDTPKYVCSCNAGYEGQFCQLSSEYVTNFTQDVNFIVEYVQNSSTIAADNLNSILNIFEQAITSQILSNSSAYIIIDLLSNDIVPNISDSSQLSSVLTLVRKLKEVYNTNLTQEEQSAQESSLITILQNAIQQYSNLLTESKDTITINITGIFGKIQLFDTSSSSASVSIDLPGQEAGSRGSVVLNITAFNASNDTYHKVSVIMINSDQFTQSNGSETQMSAVMEVMITNSSGAVTVVDNPSIYVQFEYKLEKLLTYFNVTKQDFDFEAKKKYLQCKYYNKTQMAWIQTGNLTSAVLLDIDGMEIVRMNCIFNHLTPLSGSVIAIPKSRRQRSVSLVLEVPFILFNLILLLLLILG
eukprot:TRINITY_DN983_c0_g1_i7.p1 TRINITY_DN983_c0_g1~~TRINITY_DN983_c0_g1_i7.p1  ORF type:complete len:2725 (+),score=321.89 TRINITY_DN983_c0_g1_i7:3391-11565(+)